MERLTKEAEEILIERFGKDSIIALATAVNGTPYVRNVNAFYDDGAFYVLTYVRKEENKDIANKMRKVFSKWIDNGHNNFDDVNTCILRIDLMDGLLLSHGTRYEIDFSKQP